MFGCDNIDVRNNCMTFKSPKPLASPQNQVANAFQNFNNVNLPILLLLPWYTYSKRHTQLYTNSNVKRCSARSSSPSQPPPPLMPQRPFPHPAPAMAQFNVHINICTNVQAQHLNSFQYLTFLPLK